MAPHYQTIVEEGRLQVQSNSRLDSDSAAGWVRSLGDHRGRAGVLV